MKSLLLSLALGAGLAGCATYPAYDYPYTVVPSYDPATGTPYYPPYVYPYPVPYAYPYAYPYWYPSVWVGGSWLWYGGGGHYRHGHGHGGSHQWHSGGRSGGGGRGGGGRR